MNKNIKLIIKKVVIYFFNSIYKQRTFKRINNTSLDELQDNRLFEPELLLLDKFISKLPNKEKTLVGENGITLSIGQKQRLALARCYYADKQIMILDEPSSALDEKTQDNIFNNLQITRYIIRTKIHNRSINISIIFYFTFLFFRFTK